MYLIKIFEFKNYLKLEKKYLVLAIINNTIL